jgi:hypothetical protein
VCAPDAIVRRGLRPTVNPVSSHGMQRDHHRWYSHRLDRFPFIDSQCQTPGIPIT